MIMQHTYGICLMSVLLVIYIKITEISRTWELDMQVNYFLNTTFAPLLDFLTGQVMYPIHDVTVKMLVNHRTIAVHSRTTEAFNCG